MNFCLANVLYLTLFLLFLNTSKVYCGSKIGSVVVKTSNCQHCGMGWGGSSLKLKVSKVWSKCIYSETILIRHSIKVYDCWNWFRFVNNPFTRQKIEKNDLLQHLQPSQLYQMRNKKKNVVWQIILTKLIIKILNLD